MKDRSAAQFLAAPSTQNLWMGIATVALALLAWRATGREGFLIIAGGFAMLTPPWALRSARSGKGPKWARSLVAPALFLFAAGLFQILAR